MKREEKNQISRQKILNSALKEFGEQGYGLSSVNAICSEGGISKGILYHYFKDKDELYLACVKEVFEKLTHALKDKVLVNSDHIEEGMQNYFDARLDFFVENPFCQKIFCETVTAPPQHLQGEIAALRADFDSLSIKIFASLLQNAKLRADMTMEEVVEIFRMYQEFVSIRFRSLMKAGTETEPESYDQICKKFIHVLLYGVIERGGGES